MNGFPKHIATEQDVENLLSDENYRSQALAYVQALLDERYQWVLQGQLDVNNTVVAEANHKIVDIKDESGTLVQRYLYQWMIDPASALTRLGITVAEAVAWGCEDRAIACPPES